MNNSEKKGRGGKYNYDLTREQLLVYSAGKCFDRTWSHAPYGMQRDLQLFCSLPLTLFLDIF